MLTGFSLLKPVGPACQAAGGRAARLRQEDPGRTRDGLRIDTVVTVEIGAGARRPKASTPSGAAGRPARSPATRARASGRQHAHHGDLALEILGGEEPGPTSGRAPSSDQGVPDGATRRRAPGLVSATTFAWMPRRRARLASSASAPSPRRDERHHVRAGLVADSAERSTAGSRLAAPGRAASTRRAGRGPAGRRWSTVLVDSRRPPARSGYGSRALGSHSTSRAKAGSARFGTSVLVGVSADWCAPLEAGLMPGATRMKRALMVAWSRGSEPRGGKQS
jgi:hypothetical protein